MDLNYVKIMISFIFTAASVVVYGKYRCDNNKFKDPLLLKLNINDLDGWSLSHIIYFLIMGYWFPNYFYFITGAGIIWEVFETYYGIYRPSFLKGFGHCASNMSRQKVWWYGKITDIICNIAGFYMGVYLKKSITKNKEEKKKIEKNLPNVRIIQKKISNYINTL